MKTPNIAILSAIIYTGISLVAAATFFAVTTLGGYGWVARVGGSAWIFLLSMIVLMPIVIPAVKKRSSAS